MEHTKKSVLYDILYDVCMTSYKMSYNNARFLYFQFFFCFFNLLVVN